MLNLPVRALSLTLLFGLATAAPAHTPISSELAGFQASDLGAATVPFYMVDDRHFTFGVEMLVLGRTPANSQTILDDGAGGSLLDIADLDFPLKAGWRLDLTFHFGPTDVELNYFDMDNFFVQGTRSQMGMNIQFFGGVAAMPVDSYTAQYKSGLSGAELNVRETVGPSMKLIGGLRWITMREEFDIVESAALSSGFFSNTDNKLFGGQIGTELLLWTNGLCQLTTTLKGGLYYNNAFVHAEAADPMSGGLITINRTADRTAFVGQLDIGFVIPMGPHAEMRAGYQGLMLDGVGLAPDQSAQYSIFSGAGNFDVSTVYYNGAYFGILLTL